MRRGWVEERAGKRGVTVRAVYFASDLSGAVKQHSESFPSWAYGGPRKAKQAAEAFLAKKQAEVRDGTHQPKVKMTLAELIEECILVRRGDVSPHTIYSERNIAKNHILAHPEFANLRIQAITLHHIERHYAKLREAGVGASTIDTVHRVVRGSLFRAKEWRFIAENPAANMKRPTGESRSLKFWTPEESAAFLAAESSDPKAGLLWRMLLLTGMRIGELIGLRWPDIDFQRRTIRIDRTLTRNEQGNYVIGETTKTPNARRTIQLPESCAEPLKQHRIRQRERQLASALWETDDGDLVFTQQRYPGRHLRYTTVSEWFHQAVDRNGLPPMTIHGMRHSFATALLLAGVHPKVASEILGDTVEMVLRVYSHVTEGAKVNAMADLEAHIARLESRG